MSIRVVVADSSMLIDVERGCVDAAPFALGFDVCVPDLLYERELLAYGDRLLVLGLKVLELDGAADVMQLRRDALIPIRAHSPGTPPREFHGNAAATTDGTLLFHFMDEYIDGRHVQLPESIFASLPANTRSVEAGTRLIP